MICEQIQSDYKQFMRTVAQLLSRDAGVAADQSLADRIEVFVGDAYKVEAQLASVRRCLDDMIKTSLQYPETISSSKLYLHLHSGLFTFLSLCLRGLGWIK